MSAETTLKLLFPLELEGDQAADLQHDARQLDAAKTRGETLLTELFADTTDSLLTDWERVLGLSVGIDTPLQLRREKVVRKLRERGGLSIPYFQLLGETLGYQIAIVEPVQFMAEWGAVGDELFEDTIISQWGVEVYNQPIYHFLAGESAAGERISWWDVQTALEELFIELKPAHTFVFFSYIEEE
jgi:uncharacterized protein YmfQ (DUF2313 family)